MISTCTLNASGELTTGTIAGIVSHITPDSYGQSSPCFSIYGDYFDGMCCVNSRGNVIDGNTLEVNPTTYSYGVYSPGSSIGRSIGHHVESDGDVGGYYNVTSSYGTLRASASIATVRVMCVRMAMSTTIIMISS